MISPKRLLFRFAVRSLEFLHGLHDIHSCFKSNLTTAPLPAESLDLMTIAFNNPSIIRHQIKYIRAHVKDNYTYIVADNSTNMEASSQIRALCENEKIAYIRLPKNHLGKIGPSYSHAAALNWVCKNITKQRQPTYFGFIDHDLFPVRDLKITDYLATQPIYGVKRERGKEWYLSAIMFFFRFDFVKDKKLDFMPVTPSDDYLDTGGGNWYDIYSKLNPNELTFASEYIENFREGGLRHQDQVEIFDKRWLHTINGSYWKKVTSKEDMIEELIEKYEKVLETQGY